MPASLATLFPEILHEIALILALTPGPPRHNTVLHPHLLGPPSYLAPLLSTCKAIHKALSVDTDPALYALIFRAKFDVDSLERRRPLIGKFISPEWTYGIPAKALAIELKRRFTSLKRIYRGIGTRRRHGTDHERETDLWVLSVMMLENEHKNALQVKYYGCVEQWLLEYFQDYSSVAFDEAHLMEGPADVNGDKWHAETLTRRLAMWLLWLTDTVNPTRYADGLQSSFTYYFAEYFLAAHKYPIAPACHAFCVPPLLSKGVNYSPYALQLTPIAPSLSLPCIPAYLTRKWPHSDDPEYEESADLTPDASIVHSFGLGFQMRSDIGSERWDIDWERAIFYEKERQEGDFYFRGYHAGTLDGSWEGVFTDMDGTTYRQIVNGTTTKRDLSSLGFDHYRQTWKLREYVLLEDIGDGWVTAKDNIQGGEIVKLEEPIEEEGDATDGDDDESEGDSAEGPQSDEAEEGQNDEVEEGQGDGVEEDQGDEVEEDQGDGAGWEDVFDVPPPVSDILNETHEDLPTDVDEHALPAGLPEHGFFPIGTIIKESDSHTYVLLQYNNSRIKYVRWSPQHGNKVRDVIILGSAGSDALGDTRLRGRVRRGDGLITLAETVFLDQRRYISTGYVLGGQVVGRWKECGASLQSTFYMGSHIRILT